MSYDHQKIEVEARKKWAGLSLYECNLTDDSKEPYYLLCEFPYPSGDLHTGHWYAFAVTDIYARMLRARGKNVLFPIGFDAFGLPAENAAIRNGVDPAKWTLANIERMKAQLNAMGVSFDWSKEVVACDPSYYHWTQWLFIKLFEHELAERREAPVKWCPKDQTVLANEQVIDGHCERCGTEVEEKRLTQWFLKITQYAERLLKNLETLPWREEIKEAQRAWIGKSGGAYLDFEVRAKSGHRMSTLGSIRVFTTRPDTLYGATYLVLAPEHPLVQEITSSKFEIPNKDQIEKYINETKKKTERERSENKEKTGVKLEGVVAVNPATKEEIPVYLADYVLNSYGTGAIMAVPAHDERDYEFAKKFDLPIREVIEPLFIKMIGSDAVRPELPLVERRAVVAVVKHATEEKYLVLKWKKNDWQGFVVGGIDDGEDAIATGIREMHEETGYKHLRFVKNIGGRIHSQFYHEVKQQNRYAHFDVVYFELIDEARDEISEEEKALHEVVWIAKEEVSKHVASDEDMAFIWERLQTSDLYTGDGILSNSGEFTGRDSEEAMWDIVAAVGGERTTNYRLRDWLVSRQRYWGCPIPIVYDPQGTPHAVPAEHLPWLLPTDVDFTPTGSAPLASSMELKERVTGLFGEGWTPEYDTLDTFVDSSWYFTRYLDPKDSQKFSDPAMMKKWLPVKRYSGGSEHTTMHLLYARFFTMALYDLSLVPVEEPFEERYNRGIILGPDGAKMSKSKGNVINPDELVGKYGADAVRIYLAFIGPYNEPGSYPWNLDGVVSTRRFLDRVARLVGRAEGHPMSKHGPRAKDIGGPHMDVGLTMSHIERALAQAAKKVAEDGDRFKFNTGIAALMSLLNELEKAKQVSKQAVRDLVIMLAPFAPHLAEHLWAKLAEGESPDASDASRESVHQQPWPTYEPALLVSELATVVVQVGGKRRGEITLAPDASEAEALEAALALPAVSTALADKQPSRTIYVPGRILNLVP